MCEGVLPDTKARFCRGLGKSPGRPVEIYGVGTLTSIRTYDSYARIRKDGVVNRAHVAVIMGTWLMTCFELIASVIIYIRSRYPEVSVWPAWRSTFRHATNLVQKYNRRIILFYSQMRFLGIDV